MGRSAERRSELFARGYLPPPPAQPPPPLKLEILDLLSAVERVLANIPFPVLHRVVARPLDVESATRRIETLLAEQDEIRWLDALGSVRPSSTCFPPCWRCWSWPSGAACGCCSPPLSHLW
jgi:hypothetical protein